MEHLEGQTLAERLQPRKGGTQASRLRVQDALEIGAQMADALSAAHKHGIVHRDLKPANIMLTKSGATGSGALQAKLLDFGVARLTHDAGVTGGVATRTDATVPKGTAPYMAPEQIEGREVDARTDLFALGAVLYEMVTGRRAFEGSSPASVMAAVLEHDPPPISRTQPLTPPALDRLVRKCLAKDPDGRWDSAHDVADELRWMRETRAVGALTSVQPRRRRALRTALMVAGVLVAAMIGAGVMWLLRPPAPRASVARLSLDVRPAEALNAGGLAPTFVLTLGGSRTALAWTPDGQALVFVGRRAGIKQLYVRRLDAAEARPLAGTEGAQVPAISLDGQWVAFWTPDGRQLALAAVHSGDLVIATVENGKASVQPAFQTPHNERWPEISPDGRWLAYASNVSGRYEVYVRPYPGPGRAEPASIEGGLSPAWHPNGRKLFYVSELDPAGSRRMMAVEFAPGSPPSHWHPSAALRV